MLHLFDVDVPHIVSVRAAPVLSGRTFSARQAAMDGLSAHLYQFGRDAFLLQLLENVSQQYRSISVFSGAATKRDDRQRGSLFLQFFHEDNPLNYWPTFRFSTPVPTNSVISRSRRWSRRRRDEASLIDQVSRSNPDRWLMPVVAAVPILSTESCSSSPAT